MRSNLERAIASLAIAARAVVAFIALKGGDDNPKQTASPPSNFRKAGERSGAAKPTPAVPRIVISGGKPKGGVAELEYDQGEEVEFTVVSDVADEVHVHGYDKSKPVEAWESLRFRFPAELEGIFEVELEERATPIAELTVNP